MYPNDVHSIILFPKATLLSGLHNRRSLEISFVSGNPPRGFLQKPPEDDINIASLLPTVYDLDRCDDSTQNTGLYTREDENHCHEATGNQRERSQTIVCRISHRYVCRSCAMYVRYSVLILGHFVYHSILWF